VTRSHCTAHHALLGAVRKLRHVDRFRGYRGAVADAAFHHTTPTTEEKAMTSVFLDLHDDELHKIRRLGSRVRFNESEQIFQEGDEADCMYFVDSGGVSLYIEKFNTKVPIRQAHQGDWFGELAVYNGSRRTAAAVASEPAGLLRVSREAFHQLLADEPAINDKIRRIVNSRNEKLVLEEKMVNMDSFLGRDMHIGIKGDPSLRESAMMRPRFESVVDRFMPELVPCFEDLLLNRNVHRINIGFNNGEIRLSTLLDPFCEEYHPALRLLDASYVERHFPKVDYQRKAEFIRAVYGLIRGSACFGELPNHLHHGFNEYFSHWQPMAPEEISKIIAQLPVLREIPNFYVRSLTISILKNAIHMQFNCDGTHIVSSRGFERFLEENL
jgi:CRP-like cAMP-binding protein